SVCFFFSSRRRHTRFSRDWSSDVCSSDLDIVSHGLAHSPEGRHIFPRMTIEDNLRLGAFLRSDKAGIEKDIKRAYDLFPILGERRKQAAGTLSGGEQQMLAMGRALMSQPKLLMLD